MFIFQTPKTNHKHRHCIDGALWCFASLQAGGEGRVVLSLLPGMDSYWEAHRSRESITAGGDAVKRTATQRFFDIMESKEVIETSLGHEVGAQRTAKMWAEKVDLAPSSEKISETFVDACFTVGARLMNNDQTQKIVVEADSNGTTPFDSIYKYEAVVKRAQSGNLIH